MTRNDETTLLVLLGVWALSKYSVDVVPTLQRGGARAFDVLHNDAGHQQDLPRAERMTEQPPIVKERLQHLVQLASEAGFSNPELAAAIAMAESGGNHAQVTKRAAGEGPPGYRAPEHSVGLWQINVLAHKDYSEEYLLDPTNNARAAFAISHGGKDWRPWSAYTNGAYKRYLPEAKP